VLSHGLVPSNCRHLIDCVEVRPPETAAQS
jgi:hypothetical protein